ncbi:LLM class flavin-dependent oxidoreductase [Egibacter rhizosphaerae]|uniref:LLM class flavin-dependent oxidoreductase n=1 Tax=Egibacter rhizosphaerae TaxID=1670831 RepID=A0A411YG59_9ACTN|nr:LLM class flavin-dependent oxidoreductase [Egibacter rhizosphaerae]QBI20208.1 LLM class flavin-dependent oxidoreductase [Egibacter rhizosphaerae]
MPVPLSILDLAEIGEGDTAASAFDASVRLAQQAEAWGYRRVWYAEHHNIPAIASAATSVLIAHVAAHTRHIRVGAGGVMLPNHAPLTIAEQFGTLETLHPGRIDLGLGRAPGTDQNTLRALRRDPAAANDFPQDVLELQGYLTGETRIPGVHATPGHGTNVPLYILGSSLFGARLAAGLGLPYAFASHFAPQALGAAVAAYRSEFRPSAELDRPHVIAGINVIAADRRADAEQQFLEAKRRRVKLLLGRGRALTDEDADAILDSPQAGPVLEMVRHTAVGTPDEAIAHLERFAAHADADELMLASAAPDKAAAHRSLELVAEGYGLASVA